MVQKRLMGILQQEASQSGMSEKDYLKARNVDQNAFDRAYYQLAVRDLKIQLVLDYVASAEALTVSEDERNAYVTSEADRLGYTVDQVKGMTSQDQLDSQVKLRKAYDLLLTKVTHTESTNGTGA
jgi:FKBP-type peptidyl-prolyl cis-trans isomerase (trigger factor)